MELQHRILIFFSDPKFDLVKSEFQKFGCKYKINENSFLSSIEFTFSEKLDFAQDLLNFANANEVRVQSGLHYEEEEILNAEWAIAVVGEYQYPQPEDNFNFIEATYNTVNHCRRCDQGKEQDKPFRLTIPSPISLKKQAI